MARRDCAATTFSAEAPTEATMCTVEKAMLAGA